MFRFLTAGESHGRALNAIVEGVPAGLALDEKYIARDLKRRQGGYGRGGRMKIEQDRAEILSGVRYGFTIGSPISLLIWNRDWENWQEVMAISPVEKEIEPVTRLRPGHADLAGTIKYGQNDVRPILERASARETAARVAVGAVARQLLEEFGIEIHSHTIAIGGAWTKGEEIDWDKVERSPVRCANANAEKAMMAAIDEAKEAGDSVGGIFQVVATGVPIGLGSHVQWDRRLDGRLAQAMMSINAVKGVEIGA
ncbi:MAG: chorismate synthase, partial [Dehalococcoidia bacterium]|nr:chorismate synthase [Dehalococcoidia bacterium]